MDGVVKKVHGVNQAYHTSREFRAKIQSPEIMTAGQFCDFFAKNSHFSAFYIIFRTFLEVFEDLNF